MISIIVHTHSEYSFIWPVAISLLHKYASQFTIYWCCDTILDYTLPKNFIVHIYDKNLKWSARIRDIITNITTDYILYIQEDMLLIDFILNDVIDYIINFMKLNNCDFVMSYARPYPDGPFKGPPIETIYPNYIFREITGHYMQPGIWKKTLFNTLIQLDIGLRENEGELANNITEKSICFALRYTATRDVTTKTLYFPHIHAIESGCFHFKRYPQLKELLEKYNIDTKILKEYPDNTDFQ